MPRSAPAKCGSTVQTPAAQPCHAPPHSPQAVLKRLATPAARRANVRRRYRQRRRRRRRRAPAAFRRPADAEGCPPCPMRRYWSPRVRSRGEPGRLTVGRAAETGPGTRTIYCWTSGGRWGAEVLHGVADGRDGPPPRGALGPFFSFRAVRLSNQRSINCNSLLATYCYSLASCTPPCVCVCAVCKRKQLVPRTSQLQVAS